MAAVVVVVGRCVERLGEVDGMLELGVLSVGEIWRFRNELPFPRLPFTLAGDIAKAETVVGRLGSWLLKHACLIPESDGAIPPGLKDVPPSVLAHETHAGRLVAVLVAAEVVCVADLVLGTL
jgi:hypothetical protein